jgi:hypothetical protein
MAAALNRVVALLAVAAVEVLVKSACSRVFSKSNRHVLNAVVVAKQSPTLVVTVVVRAWWRKLRPFLSKFLRVSIRVTAYG